MRTRLWEQERDLLANLSAIEATQGVGDDWYRARERLFRFRDVYGSIIKRAGVRGVEELCLEATEERLESEKLE